MPLALILALALLIQPRPLQLAALGSPSAVQAGQQAAVWVVIFADALGNVQITDDVPTGFALLSIEDRTPAGMTGMAWKRFIYLVASDVPSGTLALNYTAVDAYGQTATSQAIVTVLPTYRVWLPIVQSKAARCKTWLPLVQ